MPCALRRWHQRESLRYLSKERTQREVLLLMDRQIIIQIRDKPGNPLPGASVDVAIDGEHFGTFATTEGHCSVQIPGPRGVIGLIARYKKQTPQNATLDPETDAYSFTFPVTGRYSNMVRHILAGAAAIVVILLILTGAFYLGLLAGLIPLVLGIVLTFAALGLAFVFPQPNALQSQLIRSTFALGAGGLASQIPGLLNIQLGVGGQATITAAGAIAVYIITFFFKPAKDT
jgi:hypothetical protein